MKNYSNSRARTCFAAAVLLTFMAAVSPIYAASAPPGFGNNLEEVVKLAQKEGKVRVSASLNPAEVSTVLEGFYKRYPALKVEYNSTTGIDSGERIFTEALSGLVEFDAIKIVAEQQSQFVKGGVLAGPFNWQHYFPKTPKEHVSPNGYLTGGSFYPRVIAYNPSLVPRERVPRKWDDCLDPYWKGKLVMDMRPAALVSLYPAWGEQRILQFAKRIKELNPSWQRGVTKTLTMIAAGEFPMVCGTAYSSVDSILRKDPTAKLKVAWPDEVPVSLNESLGIMKGAKFPNAALLVSGWLASTEAQKGYDKVGRGSPFLEGTDTWKDFKEARAKAIFTGWDEGEYAPALTKKITAIWGLVAGK